MSQHSRRRAGLCLAVAISFAGCATWSPVERAKIGEAMVRQPGKVRVTSQGCTFELGKPAIRSDTLRGRADDRDVALPISAVDSLWIRQNNRRTARIVAITTAAIALTFAIATVSLPPKEVP